MQGRIVDFNSPFQRMLGYSEDELRSLTYMQLTPEWWHPSEARIIKEQIIPQGYSDIYEKEYRCKSGKILSVELRTFLLKNELGDPIGMWAIVRDLTERKQAEESLHASEESIRRKLSSILSLDGDLKSLELADIIDPEEIQSLMESFYELVHIPVSIVDISGRIIVGVGWQEICMKFHRTHTDVCQRCLESDLELSRGISRGEFMMYKCKNNMWDVATPIIVGTRHLGNIFSGPFLLQDELLDYEIFRSQARKYGFDENAYIGALERAPRLSRETVNAGMAFFTKLAVMISELSFSNIKLARSLAERDQLMAHQHINEARLSNAITIAKLGYWEYDIIKEIFTFNDHFYVMMRTTADREGGYLMTAARYVERFVHCDDRFLVRDDFRKSREVVDPNFIGHSEHRIIYGDGESGYVSVRYFVQMDSHGKAIKTHGVNQDITERKRIEDALQSREAQYRLITDNITDVIWLFDLSSKHITYISPSVEKLWGLTIDEALRQDWKDILTPESNRILIETLPDRIAAFQAGNDSVRTQTCDIDQLRKDGSIVTTETTSTLIADEQRHVRQIQGISRDITERRLLQRQFLQAQKMEAVGRLAGGIAHDFNNLLTVIIGYSHSLLSSLPKGAPMREEMELIKNSGDRAASLTSKLLAFSRKQVLQLKIIDFKALIQECIKLLRRLIGEDIELSTTFAPDLGHIKADATQMEQVIMNLAINSRDAMPRGGTLTMEASNVRLDALFVHDHVGAQVGEYVMLAISDSGTGMNEETKIHLFEPFFTTKEMGKGTGLGLATVFGIVTQSGGFISVESELGQGTTFKIYLPQVDGGHENVHAIKAAVHRGSETILFVEDSADIRALASRFLREKGYAVIEADSGPNAVKIAENHVGTIHLIITDMIMPGGMSGVDVSRMLRSLYTHIKTIIITGHIGEFATDVIISPDIPILQKPFTTDDLLRKLQEVLQESKSD
jgi:PAS domain S-box-containing protein